jgi:anthranilate synthase component 1
MFGQVTLEEFRSSSRNQKRAVVYQEFPCDDITPIQAFLSLNTQEGSVLLESAVIDQELGRYSLLAIEPFAEFHSKGMASEFILNGIKEERSSQPFEHLREKIHSLRLPANPHYPPLVGGAIGFTTYDAIRLFEKIPDRHPDKDKLPDLFFLFHAVNIAFDHAKGSLLISINLELTQNSDQDYASALQRILEVHQKIKMPVFKKEKWVWPKVPFHEEVSDADFCDKVRKAQSYICKGDAFQIVLSRTFSCPFQASPFDIYRALRMVNPSPFMFYIQTKSYAIAGSSPERLVKLEKDKLQTTPIAGTRPRIAGEEDKTVLELLQDPKEDAEHMMLVDLARNDLGVVAEVGSVKVNELKTARYFPHVIHLISRIEARLAETHDALDVLKAVFPAGTLTGSPKISAMQIIDELENSRRGIYGGCICTIDNNANLDSCIVIRTAFIKDGIASVRAGAGIVFDSDPQKEADETRMKAEGVMKAIDLAMEGIL